MRYLMVFTAFLLLMGCSSNDGESTPQKGIEGAACYPGSKCDPGLTCNSNNICQKDPCASKYCNSWEGCNSSTGICEPKTGFCNLDNNCSGELKRCDLNTHTCVACLAPADCGTGPQYLCEHSQCKTDPCAAVTCESWQECDGNGTCQAKEGMCGHQLDCSDEAIKKVCNKDKNECVECAAKTDCSSNEVCDGFRCVTDNCIGSDCEEWEVCDDADGSCKLLKDRCYQESDCLQSTYKKCRQDTHLCVECLNKDDCSTGQLCNDNSCVTDLCYNNSCKDYQQCNPDTGACEYLAGRCDTTTNCSGEAVNKYCDTTAHQCVQCLSIDHCTADEVCDDYHQCQTNKCVGSNCEAWEVCDSADGSCDPKPGRCNLKADCSGDTPACRTADHTCVACVVKADCTGANEYCSESFQCIVDYCYENSCNSWETCDDSDGSCDLNANRCNSSTDCGVQVCNTTTHYCVECLTKDDCSDGKICNDSNYCVSTSGGSLFFSEIVDHKETANAKYVEIYNPTAAGISLNGWKINRYANGSSDAMVYNFPNEILDAGKTFIVTNIASEFQTVFGFAADDSNQTISGNGDDVYELVDGSGTVIDIFGVVGVDGTDQPWEYTDSVAQRNSDVTSGRTSWLADEWTITAGSETTTPGVR